MAVTQAETMEVCTQEVVMKGVEEGMDILRKSHWYLKMDQHWGVRERQVYRVTTSFSA